VCRVFIPRMLDAKGFRVVFDILKRDIPNTIAVCYRKAESQHGVDITDSKSSYDDGADGGQGHTLYFRQCCLKKKKGSSHVCQMPFFLENKIAEG
jgi:hypothetical protein